MLNYSAIRVTDCSASGNCRVWQNSDSSESENPKCLSWQQHSSTASMLKVRGSICSVQFGSLKRVTLDSMQHKSAVAEGHAESTRLMNWKTLLKRWTASHVVMLWSERRNIINIKHQIFLYTCPDLSGNHYSVYYSAVFVKFYVVIVNSRCSTCALFYIDLHSALHCVWIYCIDNPESKNSWEAV